MFPEVREGFSGKTSKYKIYKENIEKNQMQSNKTISQAIAETMGSKTEAQIRQFFTNSRRRLSLDSIVKEHEAERQKQQQLVNDDKNPNSSDNPSTSTFLNPQFVIDATKKTTKRTENIIMEVIICIFLDCHQTLVLFFRYHLCLYVFCVLSLTFCGSSILGYKKIN